MVVTLRALLLATLCCASLALPACHTRRIQAPRPGVSTCLPPLEAPAHVGTEVGELATKDFILRVYDVRDILDLMPVVQLVGPRGTRTVPPEDALVEDLLNGLDAHERTITTLRATDSGAVIVKAPRPVQEKVADAIHTYRTELVRREVGDSFPNPSEAEPQHVER